MKFILLLLSLFVLANAGTKENIMNDEAELKELKVSTENKYNKIQKFRKDTEVKKQDDIFNYQKEQLLSKLKAQIIYRIKQLECIETTKNQNDIYICGDSSIKILNASIKEVKLKEWTDSDYELERFLKNDKEKTYK
jgi:hypothetical protein